MKKWFISILFFSSIYCQDRHLQGITFFSPRSQSTNAARYNVDWYPYIHRYNQTTCYVTTAIIPEFTQSFHPNHIAQALFGTETLSISGSQSPQRGSNDILADYFGLSTTFQSTVLLKPTIKNLITTLSIFVGFDQWVPGLYYMMHIPGVWTQWHFALDENVFDTGASTSYPAHYMATESIAAPYLSFADALQGNKTFGQMTQPLTAGKVSKHPQSKSSFSDIIMVIGYDIVSRPGGFAGFNLRITAPAGTRPHGTYLFEPLIGNGKHWAFGGGFSGRVLTWEQDGEQTLSLFTEINISHLCNARQTRTFDLCPNGFGSHFILLKEFDSNGNYIDTLLPAANVTTCACKVRIDLEFEFLAMLGYIYKGLSADIGYNGWIRSKERIEITGTIPARKYGFKGIQNVTTDVNTSSVITQSTATVHGDNFDDMALVADPDSPQFISTAHLNPRSAASPMLLTHKLFASITYGFQSKPNDRVIPFIGIGSSIEFEGINTSNTWQPNRNTLSQWALWLKGGIAFS